MKTKRSSREIRNKLEIKYIPLYLDISFNMIKAENPYKLLPSQSWIILFKQICILYFQNMYLCVFVCSMKNTRVRVTLEAQYHWEHQILY